MPHQTDVVRCRSISRRRRHSNLFPDDTLLDDILLDDILPDDMLLNDKVILITGATTGIGEAVARQAVAEGATVMIHGRAEERARGVCETLGERADFTLGDLGDPSIPAQIIDAVIERFGRLDGIVNNASLSTRSNLESTSAEVFDRLVHVNLRAPLLLIRAAVPYFRMFGGGVVVNVGSINALGGEPNLLAYSITKGGMTTMTRNLATSLAEERVRINQINVGWTLTEGEHARKLEDGLVEGWEERLPAQDAPSGRIFRPDEVAAHVVFWLSDAAGPVNGSVFEVEQFPMIGRNPSK